MSGSAHLRSLDISLRENLKLIDWEGSYFELELGPPDAYETVDYLTRDGGTRLNRQMELTRAKWGVSVRDSALSVLGDYAWQVGGPAVACYVLSRRVPDISPANVALRPDGEGGISGRRCSRRGSASCLQTSRAASAAGHTRIPNTATAIPAPC